MKKLLLLAAGAFLLTANLSSCKKGENDPFLSLKSRKSRLVGEWTVSKSEGTSSTVNSSSAIMNTSSVTTYDGANETTIQTTALGAGAPSTSSYTQSFEFKKDGTFVMTYKTSTDTDEYEGNWIFLGKNKNAELSKKEAVMLSITKETYTSNGTSTTESYTGFNNMTMTFEIDQLKGKEIVFLDNSTHVDGVVTTTSTTKTTLTAK